MDSPLSYFGGKSRLAQTVISRIPKHTCYVEPFCGAAWIFFKKPESKVEILNDLDNNIVNVSLLAYPVNLSLACPHYFVGGIAAYYYRRFAVDVCALFVSRRINDLHRLIF